MMMATAAITPAMATERMTSSMTSGHRLSQALLREVK